ncbi:unnamed protein product [Paramecium primaurelia]|uniref:Uncharacterized protein n=1 Tax=Paramecium primaurelia TaxID=5886 RepID=A0A8S1KC10_PARPR|nr:unnamed protein product [Paramecium primaurelia]
MTEIKVLFLYDDTYICLKDVQQVGHMITEIYQQTLTIRIHKLKTQSFNDGHKKISRIVRIQIFHENKCIK